jgi:hypothetical protein
MRWGLDRSPGAKGAIVCNSIGKGTMIGEGEQAPAFQATIQDGSQVSLSDWLDRGPLVLYFYPKDFTPG